jgi:hypothetical protein
MYMLQMDVLTLFKFRAFEGAELLIFFFSLYHLLQIVLHK